MKKPNYSPILRQQRRFLLVLPLLVLPFATLLFWALGGGNSPQSTQAQDRKGLNLALPDAHLAEGMAPGKLGYYKQAASDSARLKEMLKKDAYAYSQAAKDLSEAKGPLWPDGDVAQATSGDGRLGATTADRKMPYQDPREALVYQKLEQLQTALQEEPALGTPKKTAPPTDTRTRTRSARGADLERLEQLMGEKQVSTGPDPEVQQLNGMLEKILDIQHPERVREKLRQVSEVQKGQVFPVAVPETAVPVSLLGSAGEATLGGEGAGPLSDRQSGFYSWGEAPEGRPDPASIRAVVHETQTLVTGATVKLRLTGEVYLNGKSVPRDSYVFGTASLEGERLKINVQSIRFQHSIFPVALTVYDLDGLEGLYIPGGITREVARQAAGQAAQGMGVSTLSPSLEVQAASLGVEAARNLFAKKTKLVRATVKAGYQVMLRDEKQP